MGSIELKDVTFAYPNGYVANERLNLNIAAGERVAIVGQNGAGKTTAAKMMNGLYRPTGGRVLVDGADTRDKTAAQIARTVGYVFQNPDDQIFNRDVESEVEYMPRYFKMPEEEIKRRAKRALELTGIESYRRSNPFDIPYAIRKFVSIAAVLATDAKYVILDEPTAGQDLWGTKILSGLMDELERSGVGVIAITHDMDFVAGHFTRVVAMANKRIVADGPMREVFADENVLVESRIKRPRIGEVARELGMKDVLVRHELRRLLGEKFAARSGREAKAPLQKEDMKCGNC